MNLVEKWLSLNKDGDAFVTFLSDNGVKDSSARVDIRDQIVEWCEKWEQQCDQLAQVLLYYNPLMHN